MLAPRKSEFIVVPERQAGTHCRFGESGIFAECHYDTGRNFVAVLRGRRRYILSPPAECECEMGRAM